MLKIDEESNANSCWNKARDNERIFVLLERDPAIAATVNFWIGERLRRGLNTLGDAKMVEALDFAAAVERDRDTWHSPE